MLAIVATRSECLALAAAVDKSLGYPRAGVNVGGGIHVPPELSVTRTHADPLEHPAKDGRYAYPIDVAVTATKDDPKLTTRERSDLTAAITTARELDETWDAAVAAPADAEAEAGK